jgi:hypothetical protein
LPIVCGNAEYQNEGYGRAMNEPNGATLEDFIEEGRAMQSTIRHSQYQRSFRKQTFSGKQLPNAERLLLG